MKGNPFKKDWCEHIHNWEDGYYFMSILTPFKIDNDFGEKWQVCPICGKKRPEDER